MLSSRERRLVIAFLLIGGLFTQWMYTQSNARITPSMSIVEEGTIRIDRFANISKDRVYANGHFYSDKAPGVPLVGAPVYAVTKLLGIYTPLPPVWDYEKTWLPLAQAFTAGAGTKGVYVIPSWSVTTVLFQWLMVFLTSVVPGAIALVLLHRYLRYQDYDERTSILVPAALGLGTFFLWHATALYANIAATAAAFAGFYLLETRDSDLTALYAGICAGLAPVFTYYGGLMTGLLFLYQLRQRDRWTWFFAGAFIGGLPFLIYNTIAFGAPWELPYMQQTLYRTGQVNPELISHLGVNEVLFGMFLYKPHHLLMNAINLTIAPSRGVFFYAPIFLLSLLGLWRAEGRRRKHLLWVCAAPFLLYLLFNSALTAWEGGPVLGPRYMVPMLPFLAIGIAEGLRQLGPDRWVYFVLLLVPSVIIAFSGFTGNALHPTHIEEGTRLGEATLMGYGPQYNPLPTYWEHIRASNGPTSHLIDLVSGKTDISLSDYTSGDTDIALLGSVGGELVVLTKPWIEVIIVLLIAFGASVGELLSGRTKYLAIGLGILIALTATIDLQQSYYGSGWEQAGTAHILAERGSLVVHGSPDSKRLMVQGRPIWNDTRRIRIGDHVKRLGPDMMVTFPLTDQHPPVRVEIISEGGCHRPAALGTSRQVPGLRIACKSLLLRDIFLVPR